jgi:hypothetical protein
MTFSSIDDLVAEITAGKTLKMPLYKSSTNAAALAAGYWAECLQWTGAPPAIALTGPAGVGVALDDATSGAWYKGGNKAADTMHLLNMLSWTPTTTMCPATLILCDFLALYPSLVVTGAATAITPVALTRYTNGLGVKMICSVVGALGAATPNLTFTYNNESDVAHAAATAMITPANSAALSTLFQDSGAGGSPFVRMATGDTGMKTLESYTLSSGTTGTVSVMLVKPLAAIPLLALNTPSERDYVYQLPSLPKIEDGACLGFILNCGGAMIANTKLHTMMDVAWG